MKLTPMEVYDRLVNEERIKTLTGQIRFHLGDVGIIIKKKDVVGNILQEWVEGWLTERGIEFATNSNTQMPPDFFLDTNDFTHCLLEVKAFNREGSPGFDIADFKAFVRELIEKPYYLYTDFLIFGYRMDENTGDVVVEDVWIKKLWEITKTMTDWPITVQYKNGILQKMRPGNWFSDKARGKVFSCAEDYLSAFEETVYQNRETHNEASLWKGKFQRSYRNHFGTGIDWPKWDEIKNKYR